MKIKLFFILVFGIFISASLQAAEGLTYHGRILAPNGQPVVSSSVQFHIQIKSPGSENCLIYDETQTADLSQSSGVFVLTIGQGTRASSTTDGGYTLDRIFSNRGTLNLSSTSPAACTIGTSYTPGTADGRHLLISFNDGSGVGWEALPTQNLNFTPQSLDSIHVGGYSPQNFLHFDDNTAASNTTDLTITNFNDLIALINGTSTKYMQSGAGGASLPVLSSNPGTTSQGDVWFDSTSKTVKFYDGTSVQTVGTSGGSVSSITAGTGLSGGTITTAGTIALANTAVTAASYGSATSVGAFTVNAQGQLTAATSTPIAIDGSQITGGNITTSGNISAAGESVRSLSIYNSGNTYAVTLTAPSTLSANYGLQFPLTAGSANQVLTTDGTGVLSWTNPSTGSVTSVTGTAPVVSSGGATPAISMAKSTASVDGYLAATDFTTFNNKLSSALTSANIFVGNASNVATAVAASGDLALANTGAFTIQSGAVTTGKIANSGVTTPNLFTNPGINRLVATDSSTGATLTHLDCTSSQLLTWSVSNGWQCTAQSALTVGSATNFSGSLSGDVTGTQSATVVSAIGGSTAANVHTAEGLVNGSQAANLVFASPSSASGVPSFRSLVAADLPSLSSTYFTQGGNSFGAAANLGTNDSNNLNLNTNGANRMTITSAGNIGIGTTAPGYPLHVKIAQDTNTYVFVENTNSTANATAKVLTKSDVASGSLISFSSGAAVANYTRPAGVALATNAASSGGLAIAATNTTSGIITFHSGGSAERLRIDNSGNIGIGTTNPVSILNVSAAPTASANYGLVSIGSGPFDGSTSGFFTGNSAGTVVGINAATGYTGDLVNYEIGGVSKFKVDSSGNITSSGTTSTSGNTTSTGNYTTSGNIATTGSGTITSAGAIIDNSVTASTSPTTGALIVAGGVGVSGSINAAGNISSYGNMTVAPSAGATAGANQSSPYIYLAANYWNGSATASDKWSIQNLLGTGTNPTSTLQFSHAGSTGTSQYAFMNGNVGIGTTAPAYKLHMLQSTSLSNVIENTGTTGYAEIKTILDSATPVIATFFSETGDAGFGTNSAHPIYFRTSGTSRVGLSTSGGLSLGSTYVFTDPGANNMIVQGNVGIGTTTPATKLSVQGDDQSISVAQTSYTYSGTVPIGAQFGAWSNSYTNAAGTKYHRWTGTGSNFDVAYIGQSSNGSGMGLDFRTNNVSSLSDATSSRMYITNVGNVGIGTTTPTNALQIKGTSNWGVLDIVGTAGNESSIGFHSSSVAQGATGNWLVGANVGSGAGAPLNSFGIYNSGAANNAITILSNSNVGIGTTAPVSKLQVGVAPTATANYPLFALGTGPFDGSTVGFFTGNANGTVIGVNAASGYTGDLVNYQIGGVSKFKIDSNGNITSAGTTSTSGNTTSTGNYSTSGNISTTGTGTITSAGGIVDSATTASTSSSTGALTVAGGAGVAGDIFAGASINAVTTMTAGTSMTTPQIYGSSAASGNIKIDGTSNTTKGNVLLATAGGNVGIGTTSPSNTLSVTGSANFTNSVGIGTASPGGKLQVTGGILSSNPSYGTDVSGMATTLSRSGLVMGANNATNNAMFWISPDATNGNRLNIGAGNTFSDSNSFMSITSTGNIGIGTTAPTDPLTIATGLSANALSFMYNAGSTYRNTITNNFSGVQANQTLAFNLQGGWGGPTTALTLAGDGKVSAGGQLYAPAAVIGSNNTATAKGNLELTNTALTGTHLAMSYQGGAFYNSISNSFDGSVSASNKMSFNVTNATPTQVPVMTLTGTGNVGVGTTSPARRLEIAGDGAGNPQLRLSYAGGSSAIEMASNAASQTYINFTDAATPGTVKGQIAYLNSSNSMIFGTNNGNSRMTIDGSGNVGIGTTTPGYPLNIRSNGGQLGLEYAGVGTWLMSSNSDNSFSLVNGTEKMRVSSTGNVGIGTTAPTAPLTVSTANVSGNIASFVSTGSGGAGCSISWNGTSCSSDIRLKENVHPLNNALDDILKLQGVSFTWKKDTKHDKQIGFIAQEIEKVFPEVVKNDDAGFKQVNYANLVSPVVEAIKTLYKRMIGIEGDIGIIKRNVASIDAAKADKAEVQALKLKAEKLEQENAALKKYLCAKNPGAPICK